jgi:tryptophanyl-tRNA synthetase
VGGLQLGVLDALRQWVALQETHDVFCFIADLHALTIEHDPAQLTRHSRWVRTSGSTWS